MEELGYNRQTFYELGQRFEAARGLAGSVSVESTLPMNESHPHYAEWHEHVESQPYVD